MLKDDGFLFLPQCVEDKIHDRILLLFNVPWHSIDGLVQERHNSSALAMGNFPTSLELCLKVVMQYVNLHRLISAAIGRWVTSDPAELPFLPGRKKLCTNAVE